MSRLERFRPDSPGRALPPTWEAEKLPGTSGLPGRGKICQGGENIVGPGMVPSARSARRVTASLERESLSCIKTSKARRERKSL